MGVPSGFVADSRSTASDCASLKGVGRNRACNTDSRAEVGDLVRMRMSGLNRMYL